MKVDNKTQVAFNQKRNTVRITTKDRFAVGSVWIADMLHVPFGVCLTSSLSCHLKWGQSYRAYADAIRIYRMSSAPFGLPSGLRPQTGP
jgi:hypothetical protein